MVAHAVSMSVYICFCESEKSYLMVKDMCMYFLNLNRPLNVPLHEQSTSDLTHMKLDLYAVLCNN